jgi:hypothetical protein
MRFGRHSLRKQIRRLFILAALSLALAGPSWAGRHQGDDCFTVLVGKKASADGSVIVAHNEDDPGNIIVNVRKIPGRDYGAPQKVGLGRGGVFETDGKASGFLWIEAAGQEFADSFVNDCGVVLTSDSCPSRETTEDLTDGGIGYMLRWLVAEKAKSARQAVKFAGELVEKYGYRGSGRTYSVADKNEAWMIAVIRGRHWFAQRVPDDEVAVIPNCYTIRAIHPEDTDDFLGSRDIVEYARRKGWYDEKKDGPFDFKKVFQRPPRPDPVLDGNTLRSWRGLTLLSGRHWEMNGGYPFSFKPGHKIAAESLMAILRDHYEGTLYDATDGYKTGTPNQTKFRTICTSTTINSFIASLNGRLPEPVSVMVWLALGKPDSTVYLPFYNGVRDLPPGAGLGMRTHEYGVLYDRHFDDSELRSAKDKLLQTKVAELARAVEADYGRAIEAVRRELGPAEASFVAKRKEFEASFTTLYAQDKPAALKVLDDYIAAAFYKISDLYDRLLARPPARALSDAGGNAGPGSLHLTAGEFAVSFSANGSVTEVEKKGMAVRAAGPDAAGEVVLGERVFPLVRPASAEKKPDGLHFLYELAAAPPLRLELVYRLTAAGESAALSRELNLTTPDFSSASPATAAPGISSSPVSAAGFAADLTVRLPLAPFALPPETWLPAKNGTGRALGEAGRAAYRFAGTLRADGVPLAMPMASFASKELGDRVTVTADPYYSALFSSDAVEWTYPQAVGLEHNRETRLVTLVFHRGTPADAVAEFYRTALPDVPPGPAWLHDIALVDYDYLSDGGRGWFQDIDALSAVLSSTDRAKVLFCLHGWYDFVGRYTFDPLTKKLDASWTAFSNYSKVKKDFPSNVPVAMTRKGLHDRLAYARSRGFRVGLYFADGMNAGEGLAEIFAPQRVLRWGGWQGPDTKGRTYVQNPLCPEVRGFFLDYAKALLEEYGKDLDALVWDETFHVNEGSLGSETIPGYADRAMMRLTKDITAEVRAFSRRTGRDLAFMASDCIGVFNWVTKPPYALVADGTYQDTHCAPEAWSYGVFPNFRNVLWSCNWEPVTHWDYTEFGVRNYQTPVAISNGWGDYCGFAAMSPDMKKKVLALFDWRKQFATRYDVRDELPEYHGSPVVKYLADESSAAITYLSWDTEGGDKVDVNLLRADSAVRLQFLENSAWREAAARGRRVEAGGAVIYDLEAGRARLTWKVDPGAIRDSVGGITLTISAVGLSPQGLRLIFPFDPKVTPTTVLPGVWQEDGTFRLAAVLNAPDFGPMLVQEADGHTVIGRLEGSRKDKIDNLTLEFPEILPGKPVTLTLTPVLLPPPPGLRDTAMWRPARRGWLNALQPCAQWGEQGKPFSSPPGVLGNNVISDPASVSLWFYADQAFFTPEPAPGVSLMPLVRRTIDYWLDHRMKHDAKGELTGEITGYWDYGNFLDANASPLIAAWDYLEATSDLTWLKARIGRLELVADFLARRDVDGDGFVEAVQSGNRGSLVQPNRSCAWWDALNCGHKDGYTNALIYRGWRSLADLESRLGRGSRAAAYARLADRLKAVYVKTLFNPGTGWLAWWKSADGELHDYASPTLNGLAIEYGLVDPALGRQILDRLWRKIAEVGFARFDLGVPPMLVPVRRSDYLQPDAIGIPKREDGTDTFGWYMNGGITAGQVLHFLAAHYVLGDGERADRVLRAMLGRQTRGEFQNGVRDAGGEGIDWTSWDGQPTGYEGYLADSFRFLQAVLLREPEFRARLYRPLQDLGAANVGGALDPDDEKNRSSPRAKATAAVPDRQLKEDIEFLENRAKKLLEGCVIKASDGTPLYTPDGKAHYAALWTRDFASMVEYAGDLMPLEDIRRCISYLVKGVHTDGLVPDRVQVDGRAVYAAGAADSPLGEPNIDNAQFLVFAVDSFLDRIPEDRRAAVYAEWAPALIRGLDWIPRRANGLVWNDPGKPHSPYGFTDTVAKTGDLFMESVLYWRAAKMLARWEGRFGKTATRDDFLARAAAVEKSIGSLWDEGTGMFWAASVDCRQTDVWGNAYAVAVDFPLAGKRDRIVDYLVSNYDRYVWHGQVRHLPRGEYWERQLYPVEKDRYQNGAYWGTASGWVMQALAGRSLDLARRMFRDLVDDFRSGGICECVNEGYRQLESYVNTATNPLGAARRIWGE